MLVTSTIEVSQGAKVRNRYNQVPHLTQDTNLESDKLTVRHHKRKHHKQESQEVSPFHVGYQKKIVNEYDQEIPQSQTADNPVAPRGRAAQPSHDTRKTN